MKLTIEEENKFYVRENENLNKILRKQALEIETLKDNIKALSSALSNVLIKEEIERGESNAME